MDHLSQPFNVFSHRLFWDDTTDFIPHQQQYLSDGWPIATVLGLVETDVDSVFRVRQLDATPPPILARWVANLLQPFENLGVPERLGLMLLFGNFIRWRISPCVETYQKIPDFLKPTQTQIKVLHPSWIDFVLWPNIRDALILDTNAYTTLEQSGRAISGFLSVNWMHAPAQLLDFEKGSGELTLSALFKQHVSDLENWTVDPDAGLHCPILFQKTWLQQRARSDSCVSDKG